MRNDASFSRASYTLQAESICTPEDLWAFPWTMAYLTIFVTLLKWLFIVAIDVVEDKLLSPALLTGSRERNRGCCPAGIGAGNRRSSPATARHIRAETNDTREHTNNKNDCLWFRADDAFIVSEVIIIKMTPQVRTLESNAFAAILRRERSMLLSPI